MFKKVVLVNLVLIISIFINACSIKSDTDPLNPNKPITVTVWHYYNGNIKDKFDGLVAEFNETIGIEKGIVVDAQSRGDVGQLASAVFDAANESIGTEPMPDIFAAYPDNAIRVHQIVPLVNLETYFSKEDLYEYKEEFLQEGQIEADGNYYIMPIAKSSENLFVNKTYWQAFASEYGYDNHDLQSWEGITKIAAHYYEVTGNGFFGIDANANYMINSAMQLGTEMYIYNDDGSAIFNFNEDIARKIWDNYYIPYLKGHFVKTGRFSSDDAKTGTILAYTGSTAGATYFPTEVTFSQEEVVAIDVLALPYPYFEEGNPYVIQQGAGMCITQSDLSHEYAAAEFLKWFTSSEQNLKFAVSTGYLPVKNEALNESTMLNAMEDTGTNNDAIQSSIITTISMFENYELYNSKPFNGSYELRELLESNLINKINRDLSYIKEEKDKGENVEKLVDSLIDEEEFIKWYSLLVNEAEFILKRY